MTKAEQVAKDIHWLGVTVGFARPELVRVRDHIDALEAQLAQRDERIRKLRTSVHDELDYCFESCTIDGKHVEVCPRAAMQKILAADAKGEGK